jgi:hypothetical protein
MRRSIGDLAACPAFALRLAKQSDRSDQCKVAEVENAGKRPFANFR